MVRYGEWIQPSYPRRAGHIRFWTGTELVNAQIAGGAVERDGTILLSASNLAGTANDFVHLYSSVLVDTADSTFVSEATISDGVNAARAGTTSNADLIVQHELNQQFVSPAITNTSVPGVPGGDNGNVGVTNSVIATSAYGRLGGVDEEDVWDDPNVIAVEFHPDDYDDIDAGEVLDAWLSMLWNTDATTGDPKGATLDIRIPTLGDEVVEVDGSIQWNRHVAGGSAGTLLANVAIPTAAGYQAFLIDFADLAQRRAVMTDTALIPLSFASDILATGIRDLLINFTGGWFVHDVLYRPPRYRAVYAGGNRVPHLRGFQRGSDGQGITGGKRGFGNRSRQASIRRGPGSFY